MKTTYFGGNVNLELTPREYAKYYLMMQGYTADEAENMLDYIYIESVKRLNCTTLKSKIC
jgi:hypothetical protein